MYTRSACAGVELKNVKMSMNPFCENAMEEAVKLKVRRNNAAAAVHSRVQRLPSLYTVFGGYSGGVCL